MNNGKLTHMSLRASLFDILKSIKTTSFDINLTSFGEENCPRFLNKKWFLSKTSFFKYFINNP